VWRTLRRRRTRSIALLLGTGVFVGWVATTSLSRGIGAAIPRGAVAAVVPKVQPSSPPISSPTTAALGVGAAPRPAPVAEVLPPPVPELPPLPSSRTRAAESAEPAVRAPSAAVDASARRESSRAIGTPEHGPFDAVIARARRLADERRYGDAEKIIDSALTSAPRLGELYALRARVRAVRGDIRDAWTDIEMAARTGGRWDVLALETGLRAQRDGRSAARAYLADDVKAALVPRRMLEPARAFGLARALVAAGDRTTALAVLGQTRSPDPTAGPLFDDPDLAPLARDPRFQALRRRVVGAR